jgi:hypothetical protein
MYIPGDLVRVSSFCFLRRVASARPAGGWLNPKILRNPVLFSLHYLRSQTGATQGELTTVDGGEKGCLFTYLDTLAEVQPGVGRPTFLESVPPHASWSNTPAAKRGAQVLDTTWNRRALFQETRHSCVTIANDDES